MARTTSPTEPTDNNPLLYIHEWDEIRTWMFSAVHRGSAASWSTDQRKIHWDLPFRNTGSQISQVFHTSASSFEPRYQFQDYNINRSMGHTLEMCEQSKNRSASPPESNLRRRSSTCPWASLHSPSILHRYHLRQSARSMIMIEYLENRDHYITWCGFVFFVKK